MVRGTGRAEGRTVFVFPGHGPQWAGMATELLDTDPEFHARFTECAHAVERFSGWSLDAVLRGADGAPPLDRVDVVQPALFAVTVALAGLWRARGVQPDAVVGHSQGEIAAACVAGALTLEDAARVVVLRGRALTAIAGRGGILSVPLPPGDVEERLAPWGGRLSVAIVNGPRSVAVSGDTDALDELAAALSADGTQVRRVPIAYASHSAQVEEVRERLLTDLAPVSPRSAEIPFFSTVTGDWLDTAALDAAYWYRNLRGTVRFEHAIRTLAEQDYRSYVETSPHPVVTTAIRETLDALDITDAAVVGTLRKGEGGPRRFLTSLAELSAAAWARRLAHRPPHPRGGRRSPADRPAHLPLPAAPLLARARRAGQRPRRRRRALLGRGGERRRRHPQRRTGGGLRGPRRDVARTVRLPDAPSRRGPGRLLALRHHLETRPRRRGPARPRRHLAGAHRRMTTRRTVT